MASKTFKTLREGLKFTPLKYDDDFFELKGEKMKNNDIPDYIGYEILKDVNDVKTNNYSNLVLSRPELASNFIMPKLKINEVKGSNIIATSTFTFFKNTAGELWLTIDAESNNINANYDSSQLKIKKASQNGFNNSVFIVEELTPVLCRIYYYISNRKLYLGIKGTSGIFSFISEDNVKDTIGADGKINYEKDTLFNYHLNGDRLILYKRDSSNNVLKKIYCDNSTDNAVLRYKEDDGIVEASQIIYLNQQTESFDYSIDNSWIKYNRTSGVTLIDNEHSDFHLNGQFLVHHEYNEEDSVNLIPLKNNLSYQGNVINAGNLSQTTADELEDKPFVNLRTYTTINSGDNQELGNDTITLNFTFTDQEYLINQGDECVFTIPSIKVGELSPIFPYNRLNVNNTSFIRCGAFGSDAPFFADKFKKYQNEYTKYNNATYLCTWLYENPSTGERKWKDRYYYPDMILREQADSAVYKNSKQNIITEVYDESLYNEQQEKDRITAINKQLQHETFVDLDSNVTITPGTMYKYSRISNEMVDELYNKISQNRSDTVEDENSNKVQLSDLIEMKQSSWRKIPHSFFDKTNAINLNFDVFLDPDTHMGMQLFGSDYKSGFNIQNQKNLAPMHYFATETHMYLLNNSYHISRYTDIYSKFGDTIKTFILGDIFDDIVVVCKHSLIILEYDLKIKTKLNFASKINENGIYTAAELDNGDISNFGTELSSYIVADKELGDLLKEAKPITYNGNIYFGVNQYDAANPVIATNRDVIKIVLNPESDEENAKLSSDSNEKAPICYARTLTSGVDYNVNYNVEQKDIVTVDRLQKIGSMCVDEAGHLYAFNYSTALLSPDGDTLYGIYQEILYSEDEEEDKKETPWYSVYNQSINKLYNGSSGSKFAEYSSATRIKAAAINSNYELAMIRGFDGDNSVNALEIYSKTKRRIYNYPMRDFTAIIALDSYNYIDDAGKEHAAFNILGLKDNTVAAITYISDEERILQRLVGNFSNLLGIKDEDGKYTSYTYIQSTNSNALMRHCNENKLYFNLYLPQSSIKSKLISIVWDISKIQRGWYNINAAVDLDNAIFEIKINDEVYQSYKQDDTYFYPNKYSKGGIFQYSYYLGCLGKKYGDRMNSLLSGMKFDPYSIKNTKIENCTLYNKSLKLHEYQATRLHFSRINPLIITLPCGLHNATEEISRFFRYNKPASISNKLKINISGSNFSSDVERDFMKKEIYAALNEAGECISKINDINFL